jgi:hypothetical protein
MSGALHLPLGSWRSTFGQWRALIAGRQSYPPVSYNFSTPAYQKGNPSFAFDPSHPSTPLDRKGQARRAYTHLAKEVQVLQRVAGKQR